MACIPIKDFREELKRIELSPAHAEQAFSWMRKHGEMKDGVWQLRGGYRWKVIDRADSRYAGRQAMMLACLFARDSKYKLKEPPPFDNTRRSAKLSELWGYHHYNAIFARTKVRGERPPSRRRAK